MTLVELQLDGLVGPTHNYAGLSTGNVASTGNAGQVSHPKAAALQGLNKMRFVASLGMPQAIMPPHWRPDVDTLRQLGFAGHDDQVLTDAALRDSTLVAQVSSASNMWTANAATITPSTDTPDGRVQLTPANLRCKFHRAIEPKQTAIMLQAIFGDPDHFVHHEALPGVDQYGDEGAANHTRLCTSQGVAHLYVYGAMHRDPSRPAPQRFPARQTLEASQAIARQHGVHDAIMVQQAPEVIDAGVFHNDVIAVGCDHVLLMHEDAFVDRDTTLHAVQTQLGDAFTPLIVSRDALTVEEAVQTYLFNSQLLHTPDGMVIVAPSDAAEHTAARAVLDGLVADDTPITAWHGLDVRESMRNGGGPACLRLRVPLTTSELAAMHQGVRLSESLATALETWINRFYPDTLTPDQLADPALRRSTQDALQALTDLLALGPIYPFQR